MIVAFDVGTSFCRSSVLKDDKPVLLKQFPSIISVTKHKVLVGDDALYFSLENPTCTLYDTKRVFESLFGGETPRERQEFELYKILWPFPVETNKDNTYSFPLKDGKTLTAFEIIKILMKHLKEETEKVLGDVISDIVLTIPNFFANPQRVAIQKAAECVGLNVKRLLTDSSASAFYYTFERNQNKGQQKVLLYSLGAGSANVALFYMDQGKVETKAATSNKFIGGIDFQNEIHRLCCAKAKQLFGKPILADPLAMLKLHQVVTKVVEALSTETSYSIEIPSLFEGNDFKWMFSRETFEKANKKRFDEALDPIFDVLQHTDLKKEEIDTIILVGGASRIPRIRFMIEKMFLGKEIVKDMDIDYSTLFGAAIQGELLARQDRVIYSKLKEIPIVQSPLDSNRILHKEDPNKAYSPNVIKTPNESPLSTPPQKSIESSPIRVKTPKFFSENSHVPSPEKKRYSFGVSSSDSFGEQTKPQRKPE